MDGLPSWAVDWSFHKAGEAHFHFRGVTPGVARPNVLRARASFSHHTGTMTVKGWNLSTVDKMVMNDNEKDRSPKHKDESPHFAEQILIQCLQLLEVIEPDEQKRLEILAGLLYIPQRARTPRGREMFENAVISVISHMISQAQMGENQDPRDSTLYYILQHDTSNYAKAQRMVWNSIVHDLNSRRIAFNSTLRRFSLIPASAREGDWFFQPFGCVFPIIIRPACGRSEYQVIGPCKLDGFMHGEAFHLHRQGHLRVCEYTFC